MLKKAVCSFIIYNVVGMIIIPVFITVMFNVFSPSDYVDENYETEEVEETVVLSPVVDMAEQI